MLLRNESLVLLGYSPAVRKDKRREKTVERRFLQPLPPLHRTEGNQHLPTALFQSFSNNSLLKSCDGLYVSQIALLFFSGHLSLPES